MRRLVMGLMAVALCAGVTVLDGGRGAVSQAATPAAATPAKDTGSANIQEGHRLFQQRCAVCHISWDYSTRTYGPKLNKDLPILSDPQMARDVVMHGRPPLMPGFQYSFDSKEIGDIVAYLETVEDAEPARIPYVAPKAMTGKPVYLTGNVKSAKGESMEGVIVYAKGEGQTITASVFSDKDGNYYFPQMAGGTYSMWAETIGFEVERVQVNTTGARQRQDFKMKETANFIPQLSGGEFVAAFPMDTPQHRRMRDIFIHTCTTCHAASLALQNRFDEAGWSAIITRMSTITGSGTTGTRPDAQFKQMQHYQKELAVFLTEMRGPGPSAMHFTVPPRPSGASTLPVVYQYAIPVERYGGYSVQDGTDWSQGTPSRSYGVFSVHDATADLNGNIWFAHMVDARALTYGRINTRTGEIADFAVPGTKDGFAATTHGMMRTLDGNIWMTVGGQGVGLVDVETGKMHVYKLPPEIQGPGNDVDWDGKGFIWTGARPNGVARLDPKTGEWKKFSSKTPTETYGVAGARDGTGWWAQIASDKLGYTDGTYEPKEFNIPRNTNDKFSSEKDLTPEDLKFFNEVWEPSAQVWAPWAQAPRRIAADKNADVVWACLFTGTNLLRLNTRTMEYKVYPLPGTALNTYMPAIDSNHNVWLGSQGDDSILMFNPQTEKWTTYLWPTRGVSQRHNSVLDRNGDVEVVTGFFGTGNAGRMVIRTEKELQDLRAQVAAAR